MKDTENDIFNKRQKWSCLIKLFARLQELKNNQKANQVELKERQTQKWAIDMIQTFYLKHHKEIGEKRYQVSLAALKKYNLSCDEYRVLPPYVHCWVKNRQDQASSIIQKFVRDNVDMASIMRLSKTFLLSVLKIQKVYRDYSEFINAQVILIAYQFEKYKKQKIIDSLKKPTQEEINTIKNLTTFNGVIFTDDIEKTDKKLDQIELFLRKRRHKHLQSPNKTGKRHKILLLKSELEELEKRILD
ncbi:hypothetical protein ROZALSC1DRAFT_24744 [Rozella allomycis CSF55]|uniref:Uncharacterized protein n=1 Tax=Rozella allomycis (strain CSF55) TaxID=988480 RepID=A0A4P9YC86_ROZAC|nr:hypothetical protein ROZALSC1DRAFT_24744 [Rozella allomycis CSF55]